MTIDGPPQLLLLGPAGTPVRAGGDDHIGTYSEPTTTRLNKTPGLGTVEYTSATVLGIHAMRPLVLAPSVPRSYCGQVWDEYVTFGSHLSARLARAIQAYDFF
jgi:hypothetical protein